MFLIGEFVSYGCIHHYPHLFLPTVHHLTSGRRRKEKKKGGGNGDGPEKPLRRKKRGWEWFCRCTSSPFPQTQGKKLGSKRKAKRSRRKRKTEREGMGEFLSLKKAFFFSFPFPIKLTIPSLGNLPIFGWEAFSSPRYRRNRDPIGASFSPLRRTAHTPKKGGTPLWVFLPSKNWLRIPIWKKNHSTSNYEGRAEENFRHTM